MGSRCLRRLGPATRQHRQHPKVHQHRRQPEEELEFPGLTVEVRHRQETVLVGQCRPERAHQQQGFDPHPYLEKPDVKSEVGRGRETSSLFTLQGSRVLWEHGGRTQTSRKRCLGPRTDRPLRSIRAVG